MPLHAQTGDYLELPASPTEVAVMIAVLDIDGIDSSQQTFAANVFMRAQWHDPRLEQRYQKPTVVPIDEVWNPQLQIVNQQRIWLTLPERVTVFPDGRVVYSQRVWGDFSQPMDLRSFPLDRQRFEIRLTTVDYVEGEIIFREYEKSQSGIADKLSLSDWQVLGHKLDFTAYRPYSGLEPGPSIAFQFEARRLLGYYILKILLPLMFIVGMSYLVFWIPPDEPSTRISVSITAMLTLIAYRFMIGELLPKVSYMTRLDTFILLSTVLVFLALIHAALTGALGKTDVENAKRMDVRSRWLFPAAVLGIAVYSLTLW